MGIPTRAKYHNRIVRVLQVEDDKFEIVDTNDQRTWVRRDRLTFLKERKK